MADYPDFEKICGYGSVTGIGGANCRHSFWPFIEGVSERTYTDDELEAMKPENRPKIKFEGKEYDDYQADQKQRQIERTIRKQKRRKTAFEAAGLTGDAQAANIRLRRLNQAYKAFSKAAGLPEQRERLQALDSFKNIPQDLANAGKAGIMKDRKYYDIPITDEAIRRVPAVQPEGWSIGQAEQLQEAHRELLRAVKEKPVGTEAGAIYSSDMRLIDSYIGEDKDHSIFIPQCDEPHIVIHNHPSGTIFSPDDINNFGLREETEVLTAVGNNGIVYILQKTKDYKAAEFGIAFNKDCVMKINLAKDIQEAVDIMEEFLKGAEQYGVKFIIGTT